jgi:plastocyanin
MRLLTALIITCAIILSAGVAFAEELTVSQKKRRFDPKQLNVKPGDTVLFVNDDRYAHNLYTDSPGFEFDVRKQMPGDKYKLKIEKRGTIEIRCVIHPRMIMTIFAE